MGKVRPPNKLLMLLPESGVDAFPRLNVWLFWRGTYPQSLTVLRSRFILIGLKKLRVDQKVGQGLCDFTRPRSQLIPSCLLEAPIADSGDGLSTSASRSIKLTAKKLQLISNKTN